MILFGEGTELTEAIYREDLRHGDQQYPDRGKRTLHRISGTIAEKLNLSFVL
jgi:hypothetical protein